MHSCLRSTTIALALAAGIGLAGAQTNAPAASGQSTALELTPAQKTAIFRAVDKEKAKVKAPPNLVATVGAEVPPSIELYVMPDDAVADAPAAKAYRYTIAQNHVLIVDPTTMRIVDVIRQ
jgi:hypothetical protein